MVVQTSATSDTSDALTPLISWLRDGGTDLINVQVKQITPNHRGLFATEDLPPQTPTLRIPASRLISSQSARSTPHVAAVLTQVEADSLQDRMPDAIGDSAALLLFLMAELSKGPQSTWYPWIRSLPQTFHTPIVMEFDQVHDVLSGTTLLPLVETLREELREMYDDWFIPYAVRRFPHVFPEERCSYHVFKYAHAVIESRAFKIDRVTMLVPLADMANHQPSQSALRNVKARGWRLAASNSETAQLENAVASVHSGADSSTQGVSDLGLELHVGEASVRKGEQLCISYGALPNWQLLLHYGFAIPSNPEESVMVSLQIPEDDVQSVYMLKMIFLNADLAVDLSVDHALKVSDPLPVSLLASMRLLLLNEEESRNVSIHTSDFSKQISNRNEKAVVTQLQTLLDSMLSGFDVFEDELVSESESNSFGSFCAIYVLGQREILTKALQMLGNISVDQT